MPSEQQLQRALQEQRDLEQELDLLNKAEEGAVAADRLRDFIATKPEGLFCKI